MRSRAAPLHHAVAKPGGGGWRGGNRAEHRTAIPKPSLGQNVLTVIVKTWKGGGRRGERENGHSSDGGGWGWLTSILRPSTSVPWSFSLARSASELDSNVTKPKPWQEKRKVYFCYQFFGKHYFIPPPQHWPTLDPLSLKMISTSRILPNCWNNDNSRGWGERGAGFKSHARHRESALCDHEAMEPSQRRSALTSSSPLLFSQHRILDALLFLNSTAQEQISL